MKISKALPIISFIFLLIVIVINITNNDYIIVENRYKTEFPKLSIASILNRSYQDGIENYFGDQIIAEKKFIEIKTQYDIMMGNKLVRDAVFIGDDMFFSKRTLNDMQGKLLSEGKLEETVGYLEEINNYYADLNYEFYLSIGPNKVSIYSERLPYVKVATYRIMNQLQDRLIDDHNIEVIDLFEKLKENKKTSDEQLYYSYDSHWNFLGASIAAEEIISKVYDDTTINIKAYRNNLVYEKVNHTDLANIIGVGDLYEDMTYKPSEEVNYYKDFIALSNDSEDELIVIRDSFFDGVAPVFEELDVSKKYVAFLSDNKEGYMPTKIRGKVIMLVVERNIYLSIKDAYNTIFEQE